MISLEEKNKRMKGFIFSLLKEGLIRQDPVRALGSKLDYQGLANVSIRLHPTTRPCVSQRCQRLYLHNVYKIRHEETIQGTHSS